MKNFNSKFNILQSSDLDYEEMVINLEFENKLFAILSCDNGIEHAQIEVFDRKNDENVIWRFNYHEFLVHLQRAYESLKVVNEIE